MQVVTGAGQWAYADPPTFFRDSQNRLTANDVPIRISGMLTTGAAGIHDFARTGGLLAEQYNLNVEVRPLLPSDPSEPFPQPTPALPPDWAPPVTFPRLPEEEPQVTPQPLRTPSIEPAVVPAPLPAPARPGVAPLPLPAPRPGPAPLPAPSPAPARPAVQPGRAPAPAPAAPVGPGRFRPAAPPAVTPTTPPGQVTIGRPDRPVTITPVPVPPSLGGIAEELGRIERKLEAMFNDPPGEGLDLAGLLDALRDLLNPGGEPIPATTYQVRPPCGRGPGGDPLPPVEVPVPEAADPLAALLLRVDALAVLIDEQKQLRGPVCKGKPAGEPVTVTFEQVG
ncbi:MAG: hypothetical protein ACK57J_22685 [Rubrivivax sp.]